MKHLNIRARTAFILPLTLVFILSACSSAPSAPASSGANTPQASATDVTQIKDGKTLYATFCAKCHGLSGFGDGPSVGSLLTQGGLNLTIVGDKSDRELFVTISAGKGTEMPPWELRLTKDQRDELVKYLRTLAKK